MNQDWDHVLLPSNPLAGAMIVAGVAVSMWLWSRRGSFSGYSIPIAAGGMIGGIAGAKIGFLIAEGPIWWHDETFWLRMFFGKTILGGLLGGWAGIEITKRLCGEAKILGDDFARIIPIGIATGRIGCVLHGCCTGRPLNEVSPAWLSGAFDAIGLQVWPTRVIEILFQFGFVAVSWLLRNRESLRGQHFHLYLIAYGTFRAIHEYFRATPRIPGSGISPYAIVAGCCAVAGTFAFFVRATARESDDL